MSAKEKFGLDKEIEERVPAPSAPLPFRSSYLSAFAHLFHLSLIFVLLALSWPPLHDGACLLRSNSIPSSVRLTAVFNRPIHPAHYIKIYVKFISER